MVLQGRAEWGGGKIKSFIETFYHMDPGGQKITGEGLGKFPPNPFRPPLAAFASGLLYVV